MQPRIALPASLDVGGFSTAQARAAGLGRGRLRGADLDHPFRGTYVSGRHGATLIARCSALQARLPPHASFSGPTAALIMGAPLPWRLENALAVHATVPTPSTAPNGRNILGHQSNWPDRRTRVWGGIRVSDPASAWCELAGHLSTPDLVAAGDFLIHHQLPLADVESLSSAVDSWGSRRGARSLRASLPLLSDRSESRRESLLRVILVQAGLVGLVVNLEIRTIGGFRYRADLAFPKQRVLIEYQSGFHEGSERFHADMTRRSRLEADRWFVIEVNSDDLQDPVELAARIRRVLADR